MSREGNGARKWKWRGGGLRVRVGLILSGLPAHSLNFTLLGQANI